MASWSRRTAVCTVLVVVSAAVLAGCGTRVSEAEILAGAGGGPAELDQSVLEQLRTSTPGDRDSGADAGTVIAIDRPGGQAAGASPLEGAAPVESADSAPVTGPNGAAGGGAPSAPVKRAEPAGPAAKGSEQEARAATTRPAKQAERADEPCTGQGAPLALGQVGSFSGVLGPANAGGRAAMAVWAKDVNARGGLACHPVVLYTADDGADPARGAAAVQDLAQAKKVQAIIGAFTPLSLPGLVSGVEMAGLPVIGGNLVGFTWNEHPNLFPQGSGLTALIRGAVEQTVRSGKPKIALLYCVEAGVCSTLSKVVAEEVPKAGGELVYSSGASLTQTDFTAQCQNAKSKGAEALALAADGAAIGRIARSCAALGYHPQLVSSALVFSPDQAADPNIRRNTLSAADSNAPFSRTDTPGQRAYAEAMRTYAPGLSLDAASMNAWASGKLLEAAIAGVGPAARDKPITKEMIFKGLGTVKNETLDGLAAPITFIPNQTFAPEIPCAFSSLLTKDGWTATTSKAICFGEKENGPRPDSLVFSADGSRWPDRRPGARRLPARFGRRQQAGCR